MSTPDRERLAQWLLAAGGSAELRRAVLVSDWSAAAWSPLPYDDRHLLVEGLIRHVCEPRADEAALDRVERVGVAAGFTSDEVEGLVRQVLGITAERLRAHAVLELPLHATPDEIKTVHRAIAKSLHPDRLQRADGEARRAAEQLLGRVNRARAALLSPNEVVTQGPDDVRLEPVGAPGPTVSRPPSDEIPLPDPEPQDDVRLEPVAPPSIDDVRLEPVAPPSIDDVRLGPPELAARPPRARPGRSRRGKDRDDVRLEPVAETVPFEDPALEAPRIPRRRHDDLVLGEPQFDETGAGDPATDVDVTDLLEPG